MYIYSAFEAVRHWQSRRSGSSWPLENNAGTDRASGDVVGGCETTGARRTGRDNEEGIGREDGGGGGGGGERVQEGGGKGRHLPMPSARGEQEGGGGRGGSAGQRDRQSKHAHLHTYDYRASSSVTAGECMYIYINT